MVGESTAIRTQAGRRHLLRAHKRRHWLMILRLPETDDGRPIPGGHRPTDRTMWPWGHAAAGYLFYRTLIALRSRPPDGPVVVAVIVGSQLPDVIDKPLSWTFGVFTAGRALGHSLVMIALISATLWLIVDGRHRDLVGGLAVGWVSHPVADGVGLLVDPDPVAAVYFVWPLLGSPDPDPVPNRIAHYISTMTEPLRLIEFSLVLIAILVWYRDGCPGLGSVENGLRAVADRLAS